MLPSALIGQLEQGMRDFLRVSFWSSSPGFDGMLERFLAGDIGDDDTDYRDSPIFRGPFVSLDLPFEYGDSGPDYFDDVPMEFPPYLHQQQAFERLDGPDRQNTIVATGTGSGKTETFLFPILSHCLRHQNRDGIKAILIYPMNALANDQASRFAQTIHDNDKLRSKITAGLYVGQSERVPHAGMGEEHVITDKDQLRSTPPDILLTNYKMLDYLLARPRDQELWRHNDPETLKFLVTDELHTFDGAQGTDLACLIRRLKSRLGTPDDHLTCVATSATLGGEADRDDLLEFATSVFGEEFDNNAVIHEARVDTATFRDVFLTDSPETPDPEDLEQLKPVNFQNVDEYLKEQQQIWMGDTYEPVELGRKLREHPTFLNLVQLVGNDTRSLDDLVDRFARRSSIEGSNADFIRAALLSLLALVSHARREVSLDKLPGDAAGDDDSGTIEAPLVQLQVQFWQREMRRMVASVEEQPDLRFYDDLTRQQHKQHLPTVYCRECGLMGWGTMREDDAPTDATINLKDFYRAFFSSDPRVDFLFIQPDDDQQDGATGGLDFVAQSRGVSAKHRPKKLDTGALSIREPSLDESQADGELVDIVVSDNVYDSKRGPRLHRDCPQCDSHDSLSLLGFQAATLTSAFINQLYASGFNDDKKLLTFSDSVQDASHRAGFFGARTWRFNLRIAIQRALKHLNEPISLSELTDEVVDFWLDALGEEAFVGTFIAPDMRWLEDYEYLQEQGELPDDSNLVHLIRRRLSWEIHSEFTLQSPVGRSLTRTGAATLFPDRDALGSAVDDALSELQNNIGGLRELEAGELRKLMVGLLRHLMERGSIFQPELHEDYLESGGRNTYTLGKHRVHMPNFSPRSRLPAFLASRSTPRFDPLTYKTKRSWYERWLTRNLASDDTLLAGQPEFIYEIILGALADADLIEKRTYGGTYVWGLRPRNLRVTSTLSALHHTNTDQTRYVAAAEADDWHQMPSLTAGVSGHYETADDAHREYYSQVYADGDVRRIVSAEHTGLLDRDEREELEDEFKSDDPRPWYPNLLSCTPTLEMGIDVGDLSTIILCSVPPSRSNYLQRIGRAGRTDGNSLILTLAESQPHDLYFFSDPDEMIAGEIDTPGIYLNASAVLERQLTAFCLDRWAASGITDDDLPRKLGTVLRNIGKDDASVFPYNFLHFLETHQTELLADFLELFADSVTDATREHLTEFMRGDDTEGSLHIRILSGLEGEANDRRKHKRDLDRARRKLNELKDKEHLGKTEQEQKEALQQEKSALQRLVASRDNRPTMEFFTTQGLIPNYAFPEAGVELRSMIWRKRGDKEKGEGSFENYYYEYERPARTALRELAPGNHFYAGGRRVQIDRVDVDESNLEWWQFCDNCNYYDSDVGAASEYKSCPACGSAGFGDVAGQRQRMLRLQQVYANASDRDSRVGDEREERQPTFYNRQMLVKFDRDQTIQSWSADADTPFGFEYAQKSTFLDVNFGEYSSDGEKISIAGQESVRSGFEVCADCGKLQPDGEDAAAEHTYGCPSRDSDNPDLVDALFLYRTFSSESLRFLLPFVDQPGYERFLHSFIAALEMGLRDYYEGEVDHLETTVFEEPGPDNARRKQFLVLYDTIPGGTGYLKDLLQPKDGRQPVFEVFDLALQRLKHCPCRQDGDKDGCYRCLYAYRHSYDMPETSREAAINILQKLVDLEDDMSRTDWLGDINVSGLFDSALEARLMEALRRHDDVRIKQDTLSHNAGKTGYRYQLRQPDDDHDRVAWELEQQAGLTTSDGIVENVEIDLLAHFTDTPRATRKVATFTDGFQYHADRIGEDLFQRMALVQSRRYWTWSLTWHDVENEFSDQSNFFPTLLDSGATFFNTKLWRTVLERFDGNKLRHEEKESSFTWFQQFLAAPPDTNEQSWQHWAAANAAGFVGQQSSEGPTDQQIRESLRHRAPDAVADALLDDLPDDNVLMGELRDPPNCTNFSIFVIVPLERVARGEFDHIRIFGWLDDRDDIQAQTNFRHTWNGFLRLYNLFQFLPRTIFTTSTAADDLDWSALLGATDWWATGTDTSDDESMPDDWRHARREAFEEYRPLVDACWHAGVDTPPKIGFELIDDDGRCTDAVAELAWPDRRVAAVELRPDHPRDFDGRDTFEDHDWTTVDIDDATDNPDLLLDPLEDDR